jgi:hypothetical protein
LPLRRIHQIPPTACLDVNLSIFQLTGQQRTEMVRLLSCLLGREPGAVKMGGSTRQDVHVKTGED